MASDTWLKDYEACASVGQELMVLINDRNKNGRTSSTYTKLSAQIRVKLKTFSNEVNKLRQNLIRASSSYHITQREVERRQMLIDNLITKEKQINEAFKNEGSNSRNTLIGTDTFGNNDPWGVKDEPEDFKGRSNTEVRTQQQQIIQRRSISCSYEHLQEIDLSFFQLSQ
ncbi:STX8 [Mytilus edulis]|uniref:STX8 n=1 Tax=Mytilus edulis TaxID=6550 RepID=A0A8S3TIT6_MYTED|nr:STX8 [Mytilus edulis]